MNTEDPSLTLLEDRFLSSGYRKDILEDRLSRARHEFVPLSTSIVDIIRSIPVQRSWVVPFEQLRIEFFPNNSEQLEYVDCLRDYLRAFYTTVVRENASMTTAPPTFCVDVSPQDTEWLAIVSAHNAKRIEWKDWGTNCQND